jgi:hypothetical protein
VGPFAPTGGVPGRACGEAGGEGEEKRGGATIIDLIIVESK